MNIAFRVDASLKIGHGHVMRCIALAKVLKENCSNVEFICRKHEGNLIDKVRSSEFNVHELEVFKEVEFDKKVTFNDTKSENFIYSSLSSIRQKMEQKKK